MSFSMKDLLDKFFNLCIEYQQEIPPQKMAEVLREYAERLDRWIILADLRKYKGYIISKQKYTNFFKVGINFLMMFSW